MRIGSGVVARRQIAEAREHRAGQRRPVAVARHGHLNGLVGGRRRDVALPAADERDVPVWPRRGGAVAAIDDRIHEHAARLRQVRGHHQRERRDVIDAAARIARRQVDVLDDAVAPIARIDFAVHASADVHVRAGAAKRLATGDRIARGDLEPRHLRAGGRRRQHQQRRYGARPAHDRPKESTSLTSPLVPSACLSTVALAEVEGGSHEVSDNESSETSAPDVSAEVYDLSPPAVLWLPPSGGRTRAEQPEARGCWRFRENAGSRAARPARARAPT